jgi:hypothetical protein
MFSDTQKHWAQACISQLAERKLISGYPDNTFRPDASVTRAEFAALLYKVFPEAPSVRDAITFSDVPANHWAYKAIQAVYRAGFVSGYPDRTFKPNQQIPRVQAIVALASGLKYATTANADETLQQYFDDAAQIPGYAKGAIAAAIQRQLIVNYPDVRQLKPNQNATRGELAAFICQALTQSWQVSAVPQYVAGTPISRGKRSQSGSVVAEVYYTKEQPNKPRLKITRNGQTLQDNFLPNLALKSAGVFCVDLDKDGEPEVLLDGFDKGFVSLIYYYQPQQNQYAYIEHKWATVSYRLEDIDKEGVLEFVSGDRAFDRFSQNTLDSALPLAIWRYQQGKFIDATRLYEEQIRAHAELLWQEYLNRQRRQQQTKSILAAYLADRYLLDEGHEGWQQVRQAYKGRDSQEYFAAVVDALAENNYFTVDFTILPLFTRLDNFYEGLAQVEINSKSGYINKNGKLTINAQFMGADSFTEGLAWVRTANKYGYIDNRGNFLIQPQFDATGSSFSEGLLAVEVADKWGYIDKTGKFVIQPQFDLVDDLSEGLARVLIREKYGYIDNTGKLIIQPQFDGADDFFEGMARVWVGEKLGYIDKTGRLIIQPQFDYADSFKEGIARIKVGEKWGYIDKTGKLSILPLNAELPPSPANGEALGDLAQLEPPASENFKMLQPQFDYAEPFQAGIARVRSGEKWGYINKMGQFIIQPQFDGVDDFYGDLAIVKIGNKYGCINKTGQLVIQPQVDELDYFYQELARVRIASKYGYIDKTGKLAIQAQFDRAGSFSEDLARVKIGKKWGYISKTGKFAIQPQFEGADNFTEGQARVRIGGKWGYIRNPIE